MRAILLAQFSFIAIVAEPVIILAVVIFKLRNLIPLTWTTVKPSIAALLESGRKIILESPSQKEKLCSHLNK